MQQIQKLVADQQLATADEWNLTDTFPPTIPKPNNNLQKIVIMHNMVQKNHILFKKNNLVSTVWQTKANHVKISH